MMESDQTSSSKRAYELTKTLQEYENQDTAHFLIGAMVAVNYSQIEDKGMENWIHFRNNWIIRI